MRTRKITKKNKVMRTRKITKKKKQSNYNFISFNSDSTFSYVAFSYVATKFDFGGEGE